MKTISFFLLLLAGTLASAQQNFGFMLQPNGQCSPPPAQFASVCNDSGKFLVFYLPDGTRLTVPDNLAQGPMGPQGPQGLQGLQGMPGTGLVVGSKITYSKTETCGGSQGTIKSGYTNQCTGTLTVVSVQ